MHSRIVDLTHHFPGLTYFNVWDLPYAVWMAYAKTIDQLRAEARKRR